MTQRIGNQNSPVKAVKGRASRQSPKVTVASTIQASPRFVVTPA
jgi:hypothetical protein